MWINWAFILLYLVFWVATILTGSTRIVGSVILAINILFFVIVVFLIPTRSPVYNYPEIQAKSDYTHSPRDIIYIGPFVGVFMGVFSILASGNVDRIFS